jgi:hypothetical protein
MSSYYRKPSMEYVGTNLMPPCRMSALGGPDGVEQVACAGEVTFVWLHSGYRTYEGSVCAGYLDRMAELGDAASPWIALEHAMFRDDEGTWQLREDAELVTTSSPNGVPRWRSYLAPHISLRVRAIALRAAVDA